MLAHVMLFTFLADRYAAKCFCEDTMTCAGAMWESPRTCSAFSPAAAVAVTASVSAETTYIVLNIIEV